MTLLTSTLQTLNNNDELFNINNSETRVRHSPSTLSSNTALDRAISWYALAALALLTSDLLITVSREYIELTFLEGSDHASEFYRRTLLIGCVMALGGVIGSVIYKTIEDENEVASAALLRASGYSSFYSGLLFFSLIPLDIFLEGRAVQDSECVRYYSSLALIFLRMGNAFVGSLAIGDFLVALWEENRSPGPLLTCESAIRGLSLGGITSLLFFTGTTTAIDSVRFIQNGPYEEAQAMIKAVFCSLTFLGALGTLLGSCGFLHIYRPRTTYLLKTIGTASFIYMLYACLGGASLYSFTNNGQSNAEISTSAFCASATPILMVLSISCVSFYYCWQRARLPSREELMARFERSAFSSLDVGESTPLFSGSLA